MILRLKGAEDFVISQVKVDVIPVEEVEEQAMALAYFLLGACTETVVNRALELVKEFNDIDDENHKQITDFATAVEKAARKFDIRDEQRRQQ